MLGLGETLLLSGLIVDLVNDLLPADSEGDSETFLLFVLVSNAAGSNLFLFVLGGILQESKFAL